MAEEKKPKKWRPGGEKGKLHRELGIKTDEKIPAKRLEAATHSSDPEIRRDAVRAETMKGWNHGGERRKKQLASVYDHKSSAR